MTSPLEKMAGAAYVKAVLTSCLLVSSIAPSASLYYHARRQDVIFIKTDDTYMMQMENFPSVMSCANQCTAVEECKSFTFAKDLSDEDGQCRIYDMRVDVANSGFTLSPGAMTFAKPTPPDIRLVPGQNTYEPNAGRVEVLIDGEWGTVCDGQWAANLNAARVVCRQLGHTGSTWAGTPYTNDHYGQGGGRNLINNVECESGEYYLLDCAHQVVDPAASYCTSAGVYCYDTAYLE